MKVGLRKLHPGQIFTYFVLFCIAFISLYPIYFTLITSFKTPQAFTFSKTALPQVWVLDNYRYVFRNLGILQYVTNSIISVTLGLVLYTYICNAAGFALGMLKFKLKLVLFSAILFFQIFPQMVIAAQVFRICARIGLMDSMIGLSLVWVAYFAPFGTYIMSTYYAALPRSLHESARIDGANIFQQLFHVMAPMAKPMTGTLVIIGSLAMWTELPFSLLLIQDPGKRTLSLGIAIMKGEHGIPTPILSAAIMLSILIPLLLYLVFQNRINMGSTSGSIKE